MSMTKGDKNKLAIEIDTKGLTEAQIRLIKSINFALRKISTTAEESDFFETSAELMKNVASIVQIANFNHIHSYNDIPYGKQALELSIDVVNDCIYEDKVIRYDN